MQIPVAIVQEGGGGLFDAYAYLREEQASGTNGGAATTGSFQTIVLNTEVYDSAGFVSLNTGTNEFTLGAGTYHLRGRKVFFRSGFTRLQLWNNTDSSQIEIGNNVDSETQVNGEGTVTAHLTSRFTLAAPKALLFRYRVQLNDGGNTKVLGCAASFTINEVYGEIEIFRESA